MKLLKSTSQNIGGGNKVVAHIEAPHDDSRCHVNFEADAFFFC